MRRRVTVKGLELHEGLTGLVHLHVAIGPEGLEIRQHHVVPRRLLARHLVEVTQPLHLVPALGEDLLHAEAPRQIGEDVEVVARLAHRWHGLLHGHDEAVARARTDVVALQGGRGRQHDVGTARRRRPPDLVHDDRLRLPPRAQETVEILVMVERVATAPVNEPHVRIA